MLQAVVAWCHSHQFKERCVELLAIGKAYHVAYLLHIEVLVPAINKNGHSLFNSELVNERGIVHVEANIDNS